MNILVTGIGGVVGQGILRNIRDLKQKFTVIGTNTVRVSPGNFLCDAVFQVPFAYDPNYIPSVKRILADGEIDLIIPSTDYEAYYLGLHQNSLSCPVACSPPQVTKLCLDKYENFLGFKNKGIPFAPSYLPSEYKGQFNKVVLKPREGRGSRNIYINPGNISKFDDTYVVQELLEGPEITTAFYITREGRFHGMITFTRELENGNTSKCQTVFDYDTDLESLIKKIITQYGFRGSCNLQAKITSRGIIPFELNCRISGTNSIRAQFGFNDVWYTIQEHLLNEPATPPSVTSGSAMRIMLDIIYPAIGLDSVSDKNDNYYIH